MKRNEGFTLIELLCAIVAGSIVTAATATILLLGLRLNANVTKTAMRDNQAVICLTVMEEMIKNNDIDIENSSSEQIKAKGKDNPLFAYNTSNKKITTSSNAVLLEDVEVCKFELENGVLSIDLELNDETFTRKVRLCTGQIMNMPEPTQSIEQGTSNGTEGNGQ